MHRLSMAQVEMYPFAASQRVRGPAPTRASMVRSLKHPGDVGPGELPVVDISGAPTRLSRYWILAPCEGRFHLSVRHCSSNRTFSVLIMISSCEMLNVPWKFNIGDGPFILSTLFYLLQEGWWYHQELAMTITSLGYLSSINHYQY